MVILTKPLDKHGITPVHITYPPLAASKSEAPTMFLKSKFSWDEIADEIIRQMTEQITCKFDYHISSMEILSEEYTCEPKTQTGLQTPRF